MFNILRNFAELQQTGAKLPNRRLTQLVILVVVPSILAACSSSVGPNRPAVEKAPLQSSLDGVRVIEITNSVAHQVDAKEVEGDFASNLGDAVPVGTRVGVGDAIQVTIWEAAPATLFGAVTFGSDMGVQTGQTNTLPVIEVGPSGMITVPFAGQIQAAGRTLRQIEQDIVSRLQGRAHLPQASVRITRNSTLNVTVLGDVKAPQRIPLTPRGERLLDVIAQAGGTSQPLERMTIQITRGGVVQRMAARDLVRDPRQNIILQSDDIVTASFQPYGFTVLGAAGKNEEVPFEGAGITLSQALGRIGGLEDNRADPRGVFLFRWERPELLGGMTAGMQPNEEGRIPVIYQADMKRPDTYFAAQNFKMRDGDVLYVANSRLSDIQRFVSILAQSVLPVATVRNITR